MMQPCCWTTPQKMLTSTSIHIIIYVLYRLLEAQQFQRELKPSNVPCLMSYTVAFTTMTLSNMESSDDARSPGIT